MNLGEHHNENRRPAQRALNDNFAYLEARLTPAGTLIAFAAEKAPAGWLVCDGATVQRSVYPNLFANIGTTWGAGDGATSFNLPDLRGRFLRGTDSGAARDPDREERSESNPGGAAGNHVGTLQNGQLGSHNHSGKSGYAHRAGDDVSCGGGWGTNIDFAPSGPTGQAYAATDHPSPTTPLCKHWHDIPSDGGKETRPMNAAVQWLIKAD